MKTTAEVEAEIVRLHYAEHWRVGTIATQLALHPDVVKRVLGLGVAKPPSQNFARTLKSLGTPGWKCRATAWLPPTSTRVQK